MIYTSQSHLENLKNIPGMLEKFITDAIRQAVREELAPLLKELRRPQEQQPDESMLVSLRDAGKITGLSASSIYRLTSQKEMPHRKVGSRLVFDVGQLRAWMAATGRT